MRTSPPLPARCLRFLAAALLCAAASAPAAMRQAIPPLKDPRGELPASLDRPNVLPWFLAAGGVALVAMVLAWPRQVRRPQFEGPAARARRALHDPEADSPTAAAHVLRQYLIAVLPVPGPGATSEEVSAAIADRLSGSPALAEEVETFLAACDAVSFSPHRGQPVPNPAATALALVEQIDRRRRPAEVPAHV